MTWFDVARALMEAGSQRANPSGMRRGLGAPMPAEGHLDLQAAKDARARALAALGMPPEEKP